MTRTLLVSVLPLAVAAQGCVSVALQGDNIVSNKNVKFKTNSDEISTSFLSLITPSSQILHGVVDILKQHPDIHRIRIEGHTDATGTASRNQELSTQRAVAVAAWLRANGAPTGVQMDTVGFGSTHPLCSDNTSSCNARNRRVEFVVVERTPAAAPAAAAAH